METFSTDDVDQFPQGEGHRHALEADIVGCPQVVDKRDQPQDCLKTRLGNQPESVTP